MKEGNKENTPHSNPQSLQSLEARTRGTGKGNEARRKGLRIHWTYGWSLCAFLKTFTRVRTREVYLSHLTTNTANPASLRREKRRSW